jgi:cyclophilin family peptidyl-prolyl cis-trans isomerase
MMKKVRSCGLLIPMYIWIGILLGLAIPCGICGCSNVMKKEMDKAKMVKLQTSMGDIVIELNEQAAPVTVKNFLRYVNEGFYNETIFHRVIYNFMIQGGGFTADMNQKKTHEPIINEASNGLSNQRGTIAMARTRDPNSASAQFFINHVDNESLDYVENLNPGYAVFGRVIEGLDVVDAIASVKTTKRTDMADVPVEAVIIKSAKVITK